MTRRQRLTLVAAIVGSAVYGVPMTLAQAS